MSESGVTGLDARGSELLPPPGRWIRVASLGLLAVGAALVVVALESLGVGRQATIVIVLSLGLPVGLLFLTRPLRGMQLYLILLPLMVSGSVVGGLNAGEVLTLGIIVLGVITGWSHRRRIGASVRELSPLLWPVAGLALVSVASLLANDVTAPADILSAFFKVLAFGIIAAIIYVHADTSARARSLLLAVLIGSLAEAVYSLGAFGLGLNYYEALGYARAAGTFSTWNHLGGFMAMTSVPTLAFALYTRRRGLRWLLLAAFVAQIVTLLLTLTLGSILGLLVAGVVAGVMIFRVPLRRIAGAALAFGGVFLVVYLLTPALQAKVGMIGDRVVDRLITYAVGVSMFQDKFWLGFGSQSRIVDALFNSQQVYTVTAFGESGVVPHASILSVGVEKGVLGVVFFLLLIVGVLRVLLRQHDRLKGTPELLLYQGIVVGLVAFLVQDMTNNLLLHARLGIIFFALVAVAASLGTGAKTDDRLEPVP